MGYRDSLPSIAPLSISAPQVQNLPLRSVSSRSSIQTFSADRSNIRRVEECSTQNSTSDIITQSIVHLTCAGAQSCLEAARFTDRAQVREICGQTECSRHTSLDSNNCLIPQGRNMLLLPNSSTSRACPTQLARLVDLNRAGCLTSLPEHQATLRDRTQIPRL